MTTIYVPDGLAHELVALRYGADLTLPEVAKVLGEKQATVHGRVYRGLQKMRNGPAPSMSMASSKDLQHQTPGSTGSGSWMATAR